jgi:spore coat polysaccharide biosynthesis protein SpsF
MDRMVTAAGDVRIRVVIQARTSSSRLPAKVLLPVGGMSLSVLVARRAAGGSADVVVATSDLPDDDLLASTLTEAGVRVVRGPLDNVLERFRQATSDLEDGDICVRLTADNPVPDADFVETLTTLFLESGLSYLSYGNDGLWIPYGVSAEVFQVGSLRQAAQEADSAYQREHVTTWIRERQGAYARPAFPGWSSDQGHIRCTVDTLEDYLKIAGVFKTLPDPLSAPWQEIVDRLTDAGRPADGHAELVVGTVQLGLAYGITNSQGQPDPSLAHEILNAAFRAGVSTLDTARGYGESENRIGAFLARHQENAFTVITKLDPLSSLDETSSREDIARLVKESVATSCHELGLHEIPVLLLHRAGHLTLAEGHIWRCLLDLKAQGKIGKLGVSVQTPEELLLCLEVPELEHVQLPYNLLDWRWDGMIAAIRQRKGLTVHVRSVFLQGLLIEGSADLFPEIDGIDPHDIVVALRKLVTELQRDNALDLCLAYARTMSWIDGVVVGVQDPDQLEMILELWRRPALTHEQACRVRQVLPHVPQQLLNPALWPHKVS